MSRFLSGIRASVNRVANSVTEVVAPIWTNKPIESFKQHWTAVTQEHEALVQHAQNNIGAWRTLHLLRGSGLEPSTLRFSSTRFLDAFSLRSAIPYYKCPLGVVRKTRVIGLCCSLSANGVPSLALAPRMSPHRACPWVVRRCKAVARIKDPRPPGGHGQALARGKRGRSQRQGGNCWYRPRAAVPRVFAGKPRP